MIKPIKFSFTEFDNWYAESFLNQADEAQTSVTAGHGVKPGIFIPYNPNAMVCCELFLSAQYFLIQLKLATHLPITEN